MYSASDSLRSFGGFLPQLRVIAVAPGISPFHPRKRDRPVWPSTHGQRCLGPIRWEAAHLAVPKSYKIGRAHV